MANGDVAAPHARRGFRADIQGLRAIAVLSVVLYHADNALLSGGFVGVDIFFVISGYLISRILLDELETGRYSLIAFYQRRARRIFPALYVVLIATTVAALVLLSPRDLREFAHTAFATVFFVSNVDFLRMSGYFDGAAELKPLLHTWSLAVEEQFYLLYPPLLALAWKYLRPRLLLLMLGAGAISVALSVWATSAMPDAAFYLSPFRAFELLIGAALARGFGGHARPIAREAAATLGAACIAASFIAFNGDTPFPGLAALLPCAGAGLIISAGSSGGTLVGRVLSLPFFTFFGAISYSLYLWHWPLLAFGRHAMQGELTLVQSAVLILAAIIAATLSWRFVERPFLRQTGWPVLRLGGAAMTAGAAATAFLFALNGLPQRFPSEVNRLFAAAEDFNRLRDACHAGDDERIRYDRNCLLGAGAPVAAVWGDSHGAELATALAERAARHGASVMQITSSACPPALDYTLPDRPHCIAHNAETFTRLAQDARVRTVVFAANYPGYPREDWPRLAAGVARAVEGMRAAGKEVALLYPTPTFAYDPPAALGVIAARGGDPRAFVLPRPKYESANQGTIDFLDQLASRVGGFRISPADALCDNARCRAYDAALGALYFNANHMSVTGARLVAAGAPEAMFAPTSGAPVYRVSSVSTPPPPPASRRGSWR
jgi:peptidoglycan/LPS O-acetylase OafA/YrhL